MSSENLKLIGISAKAGYKLTERQIDFVENAETEGLTVDYNYSGRFMRGVECPSVNVDYLSDFPHAERHYATDSMGLGHVVYCPEMVNTETGIRFGCGHWGMRALSYPYNCEIADMDALAAGEGHTGEFLTRSNNSLDFVKLVQWFHKEEAKSNSES